MKNVLNATEAVMNTKLNVFGGPKEARDRARHRIDENRNIMSMGKETMTEMQSHLKRNRKWI